MKKLQSVSLLASASVLALTTAVYVPGYTAYAAADTYACPSTADLADDNLAEFTYTSGDKTGIVFGEGCTASYKVGDMSKSITVMSGANITLDISAASIVENATHDNPITIEKGGKLTLKGSAKSSNNTTSITLTSAQYFIENKGELTLENAFLDIATNNAITSTGTINVNNSTLSDGDIKIEKGGKMIIDGEKSVVDVAIENSGTVTINNGTFGANYDFTSTDNVIANGGRYDKNNSTFDDATKVEELLNPEADLSVYDGDDSTNDDNNGYFIIEKTLTADSITFNDITIAEDEEVDFTQYAASATNSTTKFTYTIKDADDNDVTAAVLNDTTLKVSESGEYTVIASPDFEQTIEVEATLTVASTMSDNEFSLVYNDSDNVDIKADKPTYADGDKIVLYEDQYVDLDFVLKTTDAEDSDASVEYEYKSSDTDIVALSLYQGALEIEAQDSFGTATVTVTATSTDGTVKKAIALEVTVYNKVKATDLQSNDVTVATGDVIKLEDLVSPSDQGQARADKKAINTDSFTYSVDASADYEYDEEAGTIEIKAVSDIAVDVKVKDGSGTTVTVPTSANVYIITDVIVLDITDLENPEPLTVDEDVDYALNLTENGDTITIGALPRVDLNAEVETTFNTVVKTDDGYETVTSDNITLVDNADGTATLSGILATSSDAAYVRVSVNGSENLYKIIAVTVTAELSAVTLTSGEDEVATATIADGTAAADLELTAGKTTSFGFTTLSTSAELDDIYVESNDSNFTLDIDHETQTFTVTGQSASDTASVLTVTAYGADHNTEKVVFTLNVTVKADTDTDEPTPAERTISDGIYIINSALDSGKVLDVAGASTADGANIQLYRNNTTIAQKFVVKMAEEGYYTIENLLSGKLMTANGSNVEQRAATGTDTQLWQIVELESGNVQFVNKATSEYIDIAGGSTANGTNAQLYGNNGEASEQFILTAVAEIADEPILADGTYTIGSALASNRGLDISGADTGNGANLQLWRTNGTAAQNFTLKYKGNGFYTIYTGTGDGSKVLDASGAGTTAGTNVDQWRDNGTIAQEWMIVQNSDGSYSIVSRCNGLYLDISGASSANGANAQLWRGNGTAAQKFYFSGLDA